MKVSPVQGTPTIQQPSSTGLSPERMARLKSIAAGQEPKETEQEVIPQKQPNAEKVIKMSVNKTPEPFDALQAALTPPETPPGNVIPDTDVQTKPEPEAIRQVSPEAAALARQRRALQVKERELADKEKALQTNGQTRADLEQRIKSKPLSVLQELGVTYDQLTNELLGKQGNGDIDALQSEITSLRKTIDDKFAAKDVAQEQAVFEHMKKNVDKISFSSEKYKFIRESKSQEDVMELIKRTWHEQGDVLDEEEAMNLIESELREDAKRYAKLIGDLEPTTPSPAQPVPQQQGIKTLTNKDSARPQSSRRQRALAAFLGQKT